MRADISEEQYSTLAYAILMMMSFWYQNTSQYYDTKMPRLELSRALTDILNPYLTEQAKSNLKQGT